MKKFDSPTKNQIKRAKINVTAFYLLGFVLLLCGIFSRPFLYIGIVLLLFAVIATKGLWDWTKKQNNSQPHLKSDSAKHIHTSKTIYKGYHHMNFSVSETKLHDNTIESQEIFKRIKFHKPPFEHIESVEFEQYDYFGSFSYSVLINGMKLGDIPKEYIAEYEEYKSLPMEVSMVEILGGEEKSDGQDIPYSCRIVLRFAVSA